MKDLFARILHPAGTARVVERPLLDRVFPPEQSDPERGDRWVEAFEGSSPLSGYVPRPDDWPGEVA